MQPTASDDFIRKLVHESFYSFLLQSSQIFQYLSQGFFLMKDRREKKKRIKRLFFLYSYKKAIGRGCKYFFFLLDLHLPLCVSLLFSFIYDRACCNQNYKDWHPSRFFLLQAPKLDQHIAHFFMRKSVPMNFFKVNKIQGNKRKINLSPP